MEVCDLTELTVDSCAHCKVQSQTIRWFSAAFEGTCSHPACHQPILVGERIHQTPDGTYEHARCAKRNH